MDGHASGEHDTTRYTYTLAGQIETVTDPAGNVWTTSYDQMGRKSSTDDPDTGLTRYWYDEVDRMIRVTRQVTDKANRTVETDYDDLGRVTGTFEVTAGGRDPLTKTTYDVKAKGQRFESIRYVNGQEYAATTMILDDLYRPLTTRYDIPADAGENLAGTYQFTTSYNFDGTMRSRSYPDSKGMAGEALVYTYDDLRRTTAIIGSANTYVTDVKYTDTGEVSQAQLDTGRRKSWVTLGYETGTKRLQTLKLNRESYTSPQNPVPDRPASDVNQRYDYDETGNVLSITDTPATNQDEVQCFTYDYLRRMTDAYSTAGKDCTDKTVGGPAPYSVSYDYDVTGNRLSEDIAAVGGAKAVHREYDYPDPGANQPHGLDKVTETDEAGNTTLYDYEYDASGQTTKRTAAGEEQVLDWDAEGHVASVTNADGKTTSFVYAADGSRLLRREATATVLYLPGMELRMDAATKAVDDTRFIPLPGGAVAVRSAKGIQFQVPDPNGTGQAGIDATSGDIVIRRSTPFGAERGAPSASAGWVGEKGFVGGTKDSTTGLTHLGAREYDPGIGRFVSVDPLIDVNDPQQMNGYAYANNSPVTFTDPDGLIRRWEKEGGAVTTTTPTASNTGSGGDDGQEKVRQAKEEHERVKKQVVAVAQQLGKIIMEELGITDAVDCFTTGDMGGCVSTAINVLTSVVGGAAGKLITRYAFRWKKAKEVATSLWNLGGQLKDAVGSFFRTRKAVTDAENAAVTLAAKTDEVMKGASCPTPGHSFAPRTRVLLADGSTKPIKDLVVGDRVAATDPVTGVSRGEEVVATHVNTDRKLTNLTVVDRQGRRSTLQTTENHPFWDAADRQWVGAGALGRDDRLRTVDKGDVRVLAAVSFTGQRTMYDLTVDDIHTYYVIAGNTPVLVHNCNRGGMDFTDAERQKVYDANLEANGGVLKCEYCGRDVVRRPSESGVPGRPDDAQIDHIEPRAGGGHGGAHNGAVACRQCNRDKSTKTVEQWDDELRELLD